MFRRGNKSPKGNRQGSSSPSSISTPSPRRHSVLDVLRGKRATPSDRGSPRPRPQTAKLVTSFVGTLTAGKLSTLLAWILFHDIVKAPESPSTWYKPIYSMEMRGWIELGAFLAQGPNHGLDLVVLDTICDRLQLKKHVVHECLIRLADPEKMTWTQLAATIQLAQQDHMSDLDTIRLVQIKLQDLQTLARSLTPYADSEAAAWKSKIVERAGDFLDWIINPRLLALRDGLPDPFGMWTEKARELAFYYEAMQQPRPVPLVRYGIYPDDLMAMSMTSSSPRTESLSPISDEAKMEQECDLERSFSAASLKSEIRLLRARILMLETEKEKLANSNNALAKKLSKVGGHQPPDYDPPTTAVPQASPFGQATSSLQIQVPRPPLSTATALRTVSAGSSEYDDILKSLDGDDLSNLTLADPTSSGKNTPGASPSRITKK